MKPITIKTPGLALLFGLVTTTATAADTDDGWQVRFSEDTLLNVSARFIGHPASPTLTNPGNQPGAQNYDNGFVGEDISGSTQYSSYWGYSQTSQQIISSGNVTGINFDQTTAAGGQSSPKSGADPSAGGELMLRHKLWRDGKFRFGIELGASYHHEDIKDDSPYATTGERTTTTYGFPLVVPTGLFTPAGYAGPYSAPGFNINPTPTGTASASVANAVTVSGSGAVQADVFGFRFGPYLQYNLTTNLSISASAGGLIEVVLDRVQWTEILAISTASQNNSWHGTSAVNGDSFGATAGFYAGAQVNYALSRCWTLFAGAHFQDAGDYTHRLGAGQVQLNLSQAVSVQAGIGYSF